MPIGEETTGKKIIYVDIAFGKAKFYHKTNENDPKGEAHTISMGINKGKVSHRRHFSEFSGSFVGACDKSTQFGYKYVFNLEDEENIFSLSIDAEDYNARNIALKLMNVEKGATAKFKIASLKGTDGKERLTIMLYVNGEKTAHGLPKDDVPIPVKKETRQGVTYLYDDVFDFFSDKVFTKIAPLSFGGDKEAESVTTDEVQDTNDESLPF